MRNGPERCQTPPGHQLPTRAPCTRGHLARLPDRRVAAYKLRSNEDARAIDAKAIGPGRWGARDRSDVRVAQREGQGVRVARPSVRPARLGSVKAERGTAVPESLPRSAVDGVSQGKIEARRIDPTTGRAGMRNDSEPGGPERLPDHSRPRVVSLILFGRDGRPAAVVAPQVDDRL
jgi:hypothetical protein